MQHQGSYRHAHMMTLLQPHIRVFYANHPVSVVGKAITGIELQLSFMAFARVAVLEHLFDDCCAYTPSRLRAPAWPAASGRHLSVDYRNGQDNSAKQADKAQSRPVTLVAGMTALQIFPAPVMAA